MTEPPRDDVATALRPEAYEPPDVDEAVDTPEGAPIAYGRDTPLTPATHRALERLLSEDPNSVEFFHAVRLLERLFPDRAPVGGFADPGAEVARFAATPSTAFPASQIQALDLDDADGPPRLQVNFMGLTGPVGVLPHLYTLLVAERARARDTAMRDFLDIFNHRFISLFYQAWEKYRFAVSHERQQHDPLSTHLADLIGLGTPGLRHRLEVLDESLFFYTGLLAPHQRSAVALEQLLTDYFNAPVVIEQFVGGWYQLDDTDQCALGEESAPSAQLGFGAVVGDEVWDPQARVRVRIGPLPRRQYDDFLPGGAALSRLREITRLFSGDEIDFEIQLVLDRRDVPPCTLGADDEAPLALGWATWLNTRPVARDPDDTVLAL